MAKKQYDDDDGRKIADMGDIDSSMYGLTTMYKPRRKKKKEDTKEEKDSIMHEEIILTKRETRGMMFHAMWTSLLIALVFVVLAALFLLFSIFVWFR